MDWRIHLTLGSAQTLGPPYRLDGNAAFSMSPHHTLRHNLGPARAAEDVCRSTRKFDGSQSIVAAVEHLIDKLPVCELSVPGFGRKSL